MALRDLKLLTFAFQLLRRNGHLPQYVATSIGVNSYWAADPEPLPHFLDHGAQPSLSPHFLPNCFCTVHYHAGNKKFVRSYKPLNPCSR